MVNLPSASEVSNPTSWGYHARLDDVLLRFAFQPEYRIEIERDAKETDTISTAVNPEDFSEVFGRTYSQVDFSGGEGHKYAHRRSDDENPSTKFYDSKGVRVGDEEGEVYLLNDTEEVDTVTPPSGHPVRMTYNGTALYFTDDSADLVKATNITGAFTTVTEVTGAANPLTDVVAMGDLILVCDGTEILDNDSGVGWQNHSPLDAVRLWVEKNRLIASDGPSLYDDPTGAPTSLADLVGNNVWNDVADAGEYIIAAASDGSVYAFAYDGTLSLTAQTPFGQDVPVALEFLHGRALVVTMQEMDDGTYVGRLWFGGINAQGVLTNMQTIKEWEGLASDYVAIDAIERDGIYVGIPADTGLDLWRFDVEYAALTRDLFFSTPTGYCGSILRAKGRTFISTSDGVIGRESNTKVSEGWLVGPLADFFTSDDKVWDKIKVGAKFPTSGTLAVSATSNPNALDRGDDDNYWTQLRTLSVANDTEVLARVDSSRFLSVRVVLTGGAVLESYSVRALPPPSDESVLLPINVSDSFGRPGVMPYMIEDYGEELWKALRNLQGRSIELEIYPIDLVWRGSISLISTQVESIYDNGSTTKYVRVLFRGREFIRESSSTSVFGAGMFGTIGFGTRSHRYG